MTSNKKYKIDNKMVKKEMKKRDCNKLNVSNRKMAYNNKKRLLSKNNLLIIGLLTIIVLSLIVGGLQIADLVKSDFDSGSYSHTYYNNYSSNELPNNNGVNKFIDMHGNVLLMHMNEASGDIIDSSGHGNNGTVNGGVSYNTTGGKIGGALSFDGSSGFVSVPHNSGFSPSQYTIEAWFKTTVASGYRAIISNAQYSPLSGFNLGTNDGSLYFQVFTAGGEVGVYTDAPVDFADGQWHQVAAAYDGTTLQIFFDSRLVKSQAVGSVIDGGDLYIGVHPWDGSMYWFFNGSIDEVSIFNKALSQADISAIYNSQKGNYVGLEVYNDTARELPDNGQSDWTGINMTGNVLLMHLNDKIADSSGNEHHGTPMGSPKPAVVAGVSGNALQFDGSQNYVVVPYNSNLNLGSIFTIEAWVYINSYPNGYTAFCGQEGSWILYDDGAELVFYLGDGVNNIYGSSRVPAGGWHHIAVVDDSGTYYMFIDGTLIPISGSGTVENSVSNILIGGRPSQNYWLNGKIDEVRISNTARYTTNFNSNLSRNFTTDANTVAYWNFDNVPGAVIDSSPNKNYGQAVGGADTVVSDIKDNGHALQFDGSNYVSASGSTDFTPSKFTAEAWVKTSNSADVHLPVVGNFDGTVGTYMFQVRGSSGTEFDIYTDGGFYYIPSAVTVNDGNWHHVAMTWDGSTITGWVDGVSVGSTGTTGSLTSTSPLLIGIETQSNNHFDGAIDEVRISNTTRYTSNFTPSRTFTSDVNTVAYYNFEEGNGTVLHDLSGNGHNGTLVNSPTWTQGVGQDRQGIMGRAGKFDGSACVTVDNQAELSKKANWTLGAWVDLTGESTNVIYSENNGEDFIMYLGAGPAYGGDVRIHPQTVILGDGGILYDQWNYVVLAYNDGTIKYYLNGQLKDQKTGVEFSKGSAGTSSLGCWNNNQFFRGKIDEVTLWNRSLSSSEIQGLYNGGNGTQVVGNESGLVAAYHMNEQTWKDVVDSSGNMNNGVLNGGVTEGVSGKLNTGMSFDGNGELVTIKGSDAFNSPDLTIEFWAKLAPDGTYQRILGNGEWRAEVGPEAPNLRFYSSSPNIALDSLDVVYDNKWHNIAIVINSHTGIAKKFVDGVVTQTQTGVSALPSSTNDLWLGMSSNPNDGYYLNGLLDEVAIWNRTLSTSEINQIYNRQKGKYGLGVEGNYTSAVKNTGYAHVNNISWESNAGEMPDNQQSSLMQGNVLLMHLNDKIEDISGNGHGGSPVGNPLPAAAPGVSGNALQFDGSQNYVSVPYSSSFYTSGKYTFEFWVKTKTTTTAYWINLGGAQPYGLAFWYDSGTVYFGPRNGAYGNLATTAVTDGNWHHLAAVYNGSGTWELFVDGVSDGTINVDGPNDNGGNLQFGVSQGDNRYADITLDEVRISNVARYTSDFSTNLPRNYTSDANTVAYWNFDRSSGSVVDATGNANTGTGQNGADTVVDSTMPSGLSGRAGKFDGSNYVQINDQSSFPIGSSSRTISAWIKPTSLDSYSSVLQYGALASDKMVSLQIRGGHLYFAGWYDDLADTTTAIQLDEWTHIAFTYNGSYGYLYVNGVQVATAPLSLNTQLDALPLIGKYYDGTDYYFNGKIDEVTLWNRSLSSSEIRGLYNGGNGTQVVGNETGLVAAYHMNEQTWKDVVDSSGNGNNGALNGGVTEGVSGKLNSAMSFDGSGYVSVPATRDFITKVFSYEAWIKTSESATKTILGLDGTNFGWYLNALGNPGAIQGGLYIIIDGGSTIAGTKIVTDGNWHHIAVTSDGTTVTLWVDGQSDGTLNPSSFGNTGGNLNLGNWQSNGFVGSMDEVSIWNRSLSALEVQKVYQMGLTRLNLSVRSCTSADCSDANFTNLGFVSSPQTLNLENKNYFQYKFGMSTTDSDYTPELYNVSVDYKSLKGVSFNSGTATDYANLSQNYIYVNVTVTNLVQSNITFNLYNNSGRVNSTIYRNNYTTSINWTRLADGVYRYNVSVVETTGDVWSTETRTIMLDTHAPNGTLLLPLNGSYSNNANVNFSANVSDNLGLKNGTLNIVNSTGGIVSQITNGLGGTLQSTVGVVVTLVDGVYSWFYNLFDFAGNMFNTGNRTVTVDTVAPGIEYTSPSVNSGVYLNRNYIEINTSVNEINFANLTVGLFNNSGRVNGTLFTSAPFYVNYSNLPEGIYYYNVTAVDLAGNVNSAATRNITLDRTNPLIAFGSGTENTGVNRSQGSIYLNVSVVEVNEANITFNLYNGDGLVNSSVFTNGQREINWTNLVDGHYYYNVTDVDLAGNTNSTETRDIVLDRIKPRLLHVNYFPFTNDDVDPGVNITFNASVSDDRAGVESVILEYNNGTDWANSTMNLVSGSILNGVYQTNITTIPTDTNYTWRIYFADFAGNSNESTNRSFESRWDCTWHITPANMGSFGGFDETRNIANFTIVNTGDPQFENHACGLSFKLNYNFPSSPPRVYFDGKPTKPSKIYDVAAKENRTIGLNVTFLSELNNESLVITADDLLGISENESNNAYAVIVSSFGAYLDTKITEPTSGYNMYLTPGNHSFSAFVKNLVDATNDPQNKTAYNVSFNWNFQEGLIGKTLGNLTNYYDQINNTDEQINELILELNSSNIVDMNQGSVNVSIYASGYENSTGNLRLISDVANNTLFSDRIQVNLLCFDEIDGICVSSCGHALDKDCPVENNTINNTITNTVTINSGSGGGGGGGGAEFKKSELLFQIVRGKQNEIKIPFKNVNPNLTLSGVKFDLSGRIARYIVVEPAEMDAIAPSGEIDVLLKISSPSYLPLGKESLVLTIKGKLGEQEYTEQKNIVLEIVEINSNETLTLLEKSRELVKQLQEAGLKTDKAEQLLNESQTAYGALNFGKISDNYNIISKEVSYGLNANKILKELDSLLIVAKEKGINTANTERLVKLAKLSMDREEYDQAYSRAKEAQVSYALEVKGEFGKLSYYIKENPVPISLGILFIALFSFASVRIGRYEHYKNTIKKLHEEEKILYELIKAVQTEVFVNNRMDMDEYRSSISQYQKKLVLIYERLIELNTKVNYSLKISSGVERLKIEKSEIVKMIKDLQEDYLLKKLIDGNVYQWKLESLTTRLGDIEEKIATYEGQAAMKKQLGFFRRFMIPKEVLQDKGLFYKYDGKKFGGNNV